jgi:uncharacterized membrane protein
MLLVAAGLVAIPLAAMQFTAEVKWSIFDFVIAGVLLFGASFAIEFVLRTVKKFEHRLILCAVVLAGLVILWLELAVGIFGSPIAGS